MGHCLVIGFTLLLITVSFSSFPSETAATETRTYDSVRKIFGFVKQKSPELGAAGGIVFESSVYYGSVAVKWVGAAVRVGCESSVYYGWPAVKWAGAAEWDVCESCYCYGSSAVKRVGDAVRESVNSYLHNGTGTASF